MKKRASSLNNNPHENKIMAAKILVRSLLFALVICGIAGMVIFSCVHKGLN